MMQDLALTPRSMPSIPVKCVCKVTAAWSIADAQFLAQLQDLHIYTESFLSSRMKWRPGQPLTLLEVAAHCFADPVLVQNEERFWGCFSWTTIAADQLDLDRTRPALDAADFAAAQQRLRGAMQSAEQVL